MKIRHRNDEAEFIEWLRGRLAPGETVEAALGRAHAGDRRLAWACGRGDAAALARLEELLGQAVAALRLGDGLDADEVIQELRERLLVGERPRIGEYAGGGPIAGWLRIAARRIALDKWRGARRRRRAEASSADAGARTLSTARGLADQELELLRGAYRGAVERALKSAVAQLDPGRRQLLRLHYVEGASLQQLGRVLRVDRATASRRVAEARRILLEEVKRLLRDELQLTPASLESVLRAVRSQLEIGLSGLLG